VSAASFLSTSESSNWLQKDVITTFCYFVHFFPSRQAGESWSAQHPGTFLLSIDEAHVLARLKNEAQYREVLGKSAHLAS
jgi:hypothetical protein